MPQKACSKPTAFVRTFDDSGNIGHHEGLMYHTLGQRKGLGIGGLKNSGDDPWYVAGKDLINNRLLVVQGADHPSLFAKGLIASQLHWVDRVGPGQPLRCSVKTRYRQHDIPCTVTPLPSGELQVNFDQPQKAVTPGQSAVFYLDDVCLGGGIIDKALN